MNLLFLVTIFGVGVSVPAPTSATTQIGEFYAIDSTPAFQVIDTTGIFKNTDATPGFKQIDTTPVLGEV